MHGRWARSFCLVKGNNMWSQSYLLPKGTCVSSRLTNVGSFIANVFLFRNFARDLTLIPHTSYFFFLPRGSTISEWVEFNRNDSRRVRAARSWIADAAGCCSLWQSFAALPSMGFSQCVILHFPWFRAARSDFAVIDRSRLGGRALYVTNTALGPHVVP